MKTHICTIGVHVQMYMFVLFAGGSFIYSFQRLVFLLPGLGCDLFVASCGFVVFLSFESVDSLSSLLVDAWLTARMRKLILYTQDSEF